MPCRSKKRCRAAGRNIAPDPLVDAGNPPHRHETRTTPHPTCLRHRVVTLAPRPPSRSQTRTSQKDNATVMLDQLYDNRGLAVLFDQAVSVSFVDGRIKLDTKMTYRYALSAVSANASGLVYQLDGTGTDRSIKAQYIDELGSIVNAHFDQLARQYEPLARVRDYAGLVAFLRWAACPGEAADGACARRKGLAIDFSALGRYDRHDGQVTPTPDMVGE